MHILNSPFLWFWLPGAVALVGQGCVLLSIWTRNRRLRKVAVEAAVESKKYAQVPVEDWEKAKATLSSFSELFPMLQILAAASQDGYTLVKKDEYQGIIKQVAALSGDDPAQYPERLGKILSGIDNTTLRTEADLKAAVGRVTAVESKIEKTEKLAQDAYSITVGLIPESGVSASKVGGAMVTTGFPDLDPAAFVKK